MPKSRLQRVKDAIVEVFGSLIEAGTGRKAQEVVDKDVYTGESDPGQWSPTAVAIIHCEDGIPNGTYDNVIIEKWFDVTNLLGDMYVEHVNAAVIAVWTD